MEITSWTDLFPEDAIGKLRYLGNTVKFSYCPNCQVCRDLMA